MNLHNVYTLESSELGPCIATLSAPVMEAVDAALVFALGIGEARESAG